MKSNNAKILKLIKNTEDRKTVEKYLQDLQSEDSAKASPDHEKRKLAKKALDIIIRAGWEIGKHELITGFLHLFD